MKWEAELKAAREAARVAGDVIVAAYQKFAAAESAPADITTQTDRDAQEAILRSLLQRFPHDAYRAEENTRTLAAAKQVGSRMWIIDPIDGTRGFVMKNGEFSVMIGLAVDGIPVVGVVHEPAMDRTTFAADGAGCHQTVGTKTTRVNVSGTANLEDAVLVQSHTKAGRGMSKEVATLRPKTVLETYSAGVKLARVADGTADLYVCDYMAMNDWDLAAGHALVVEAGGRVSNLSGESRIYGRESPIQAGGLLATNGRVHDATIAALR
ncbi:MAG: 3'(2'),5'-bisphosphate nucleotidase CysQ [Gemmataceae bacterium]|nr:3'(2'),5'-bisphosphate nucleotidase CysQ [Gemmataceae bacterium]